MLLSIRDVELMKLLRWCQYIRVEDAARIFSETEIENLIACGYIKPYKDSGSFVLTAIGNHLLSEVFDRLPQDLRAYRTDAIERRIRLARLTLTTYRAGIDIFTTSLTELSSAPSYFLPSITRGRGTNPWGNSRMAAVGAFGGMIAGFHYVCSGIGKLLLSDEIATFSNNTSRLPYSERRMFFAGRSYGELLAELQNPEESVSRLVTYAEAFRKIPMPISLLACNDTGALQLRLMTLADYKARLSKAALKEYYRPPPPELAWCDALFSGVPLLVGVDMNLRHMDDAISRASHAGFSHIILVALEEQTEQVLSPRYNNTGQVRLFALTDTAIEETLDGLPRLCSPSNQPFYTSKGDVLDAPPVQRNRKTVKVH